MSRLSGATYPSGQPPTTFVYATGINVPDYMVRGAETFALIRDHLGSVRFVVNTATNAIAQELRYDAFGEVLLDTNPGFQPFGYAGGLYDPDTGLTRFGARDYDAHTGRWTARDPIAFGGGQTNLYVCVGNDPINFVDPSGSVAIPAVLGAIWGAIEFGLAVYDVYDFATTMMDSCSTTSDRLMSAGGVLAGAILPGGGYGAGSKAALKALPPPRPVWTGQIINYKKGAMSSIEHIFYRHGPESGFSLVGRFAEGTRGRDVVRMVEEAARGGKWDWSNGRASILYDFQRTIGTHVDGSSATRLQVYLNQAGEVMTAFPVK